MQTDPFKRSQTFRTIMEHLKELGLVLPHDTDDSNFLDRLLTALMTANAARDNAEQEAAANPGRHNPDLPRDRLGNVVTRLGLEDRRRQNEASTTTRLNALVATGRATIAAVRAKTTSGGSVRMNLADLDLKAWIARLEQLPAGYAWRSRRTPLTDGQVAALAKFAGGGKRPA